MNDLALITWTHNEYDDIWPMYFGRLDRHLSYKNSYIFLDKESEKIPVKHTQLINNDNDPWYKRFLECLARVPEKYVLYLQEDHIFYDDCDMKKLNNLLDYFKNSIFSSMRLIKSGELGGYEFEKNLYAIPNDSQYLFSQQSAFWDKNELGHLISHYKPKTFRDVELYGSDAMRQLSKRACYYYDGAPRRGSLHCDSNIFPYVATAICKGKWNTTQYPDILAEAFNEYNINKNKRGVL